MRRSANPARARIGSCTRARVATARTATAGRRALPVPPARTRAFKMHSIVQVLQTSSIYDLTTVEAANAFLKLTSSPENDAIIASQITAASQIIATQCDRVFAMQDVLETFIMRWGEYVEAFNLDRQPVIALQSIV